MKGKEKFVKRMRSAASDKETLNRQILRLCRNFREVEKFINRVKKP